MIASRATQRAGLLAAMLCAVIASWLADSAGAAEGTIAIRGDTVHTMAGPRDRKSVV